MVRRRVRGGLIQIALALTRTVVVVSVNWSPQVNAAPIIRRDGVCTDETRNDPALCVVQDAEPRDVLIAAVGDVLLDERLQAQGMSGTEGFYGIWRDVVNVFAAADLAYANLEGPAAADIGKNGDRAHDVVATFDNWVYSGYPMFNYPPAVPRALRQAGFDVLSTANNHALDRYKIGVTLTLDSIERAGLVGIGTRRPDSSRRPWAALTAINVDGTGYQIAWIACTYDLNVRVPGREDVLHCYRDRSAILDEISHLHERTDISAIIVTPHWGRENSLRIGDEQRQFARDLINSGVTAVIGSHPHLLQDWEWLTAPDGRRAPVFYSMGNFVSDQAETAQRQSIILLLSLVRSSDGWLHVSSIDQVPIGMAEDNGLLRVRNLTHDRVLANVAVRDADSSFLRPHRPVLASHTGAVRWLDMNSYLNWIEIVPSISVDAIRTEIEPAPNDASSLATALLDGGAGSFCDSVSDPEMTVPFVEEPGRLIPVNCIDGAWTVPLDASSGAEPPTADDSRDQPASSSSLTMPSRETSLAAVSPAPDPGQTASRAFANEVGRRLAAKVTISGDVVELTTAALFEGDSPHPRSDTRWTIATIIDVVLAQVRRNVAIPWYVSIDVGSADTGPATARVFDERDLASRRFVTLRDILISEGMSRDHIRESDGKGRQENSVDAFAKGISRRDSVRLTLIIAD